MSDQGKIKVFLIQLMFPDSQAKKKKKTVGKKWRIIFLVTKFFIDDFSTDEILCRLFPSNKVF